MVGRPLKANCRIDADWMALSLSRRAIEAAPMTSGAALWALLRTTRTREPPVLVRTICRSVWFVKCAKGNGANVCPGGGATTGAGAAGHWFAMKGGSAGAAGGGV